ncbi:bifunctional UDP-sugar hydrolase/5'-nucleotidase [Methylocapsa sp. D3K7]|uniref:bifunctional metallophosphatase/5'-nucleotidase n=1 Tax=Methylocapsa sp. D3K7 TaxID=3041435 RepID=UPI00244E74A5|nr:bifunctional UDP-sugar hydrolase/5'-nucleotidase [Methylocapsa sp. D3K7]WGJ15848.1 bifunctional UDP-sugar hydrolase/5'-nucleotidase [Methylocapsa sp. D3K7]
MQKLSRRQTLTSILAAGATVAVPPARADGATARVSLLLINDIYRIEEKNGRGGMARFAAVVRAERARTLAEDSHLICVHAGDTLSPSLLSSFDQGAHMVDLFNDLELNAFVPGNHEFDFGKEVYFDRMRQARFPVLAANLRSAAGMKLPRHEDQILIEAGKLNLAFIGTAFDGTAIASRPGDLVFSPTISTVLANAEKARAAGADLVIAIVHADKATGAALMNSHAVDFILSGHNHDLHIDFDGRTALMESEQDANYVTIADIEVTQNRGQADRSSSWWPNFRVIDTAKVISDPAMLAKVQMYSAGLNRLFDVEIATLAAALDSRTGALRSGECAIGDLVADALRSASAAEVAIINGGSIRGNRIYAAGTRLTKRDILDELPFGNKTMATKVSGTSIVDALENGFSQIERPTGRFPQVSGLVVSANPAAPPGERVKTVWVNGEALDLGREYKIATNDFMASGGDGYGMLAGKTHVSPDSGTRLVALDVIDYIAAAKRIDAKIEGRIVFQ